jgi:hypothetical protein
MSFRFVIEGVAKGVTTRSPHYTTVDDALRGAAFMLGNGAASVWIVDGDGKLVLPADQVRLRLNPLGRTPPVAPLGAAPANP